MGKRGPATFKRNDGLRALKIARDGGIEPALVEIIAKDGTTYRIYGDRALPTPASSEACVSKEWQDEIDKLKKPK